MFNRQIPSVRSKRKPKKLKFQQGQEVIVNGPKKLFGQVQSIRGKHAIIAVKERHTTAPKPRTVPIVVGTEARQHVREEYSVKKSQTKMHRAPLANIISKQKSSAQTSRRPARHDHRSSLFTKLFLLRSQLNRFPLEPENEGARKELQGKIRKIKESLEIR